MQRRLALLFILLLVPAPALAHEEDSDVARVNVGDPGAPKVPAGYTGAGREPYLSFFEGVWLYGQAGVSPLGNQYPRDMEGDGDWLVWEDAIKSDIFVYNIPAGTGFYVTSDRFAQRRPDISGNVVVWEDYRNHSRPNIWAYFLDTGESRLLSSGPGAHANPSIDKDLVAWEDDRAGSLDIWGYDLANRTEFPIYVGGDRESDPIILGQSVFFRTFRFGVFDIMMTDLERNETLQITSDLALNSQPFTNGEDVYFLNQFYNAWRLQRYDIQTGLVEDTKLSFQENVQMSAEGSRMLFAARDMGYRQLVAYNLTTGTSTHVSYNLILTTEPILMDRTAYVPTLSHNGTSLLALEVSPFAFGKRATLDILTPRATAFWTRPITLQGDLSVGEGWAEPATFTYRIDDGPPQAIPFSQRFSIPLDPRGFHPGTHEIVLRATFREGPPVEASVDLIVPQPVERLDIAEAGPQFHAARAFGYVNYYVFANPASWFILVLAIILLVLVLVRLWVWFRPRRRRVVIEYVPQDP